MLPHLRLNVARNSSLINSSRVHIQALHWGEAGAADLRALQPRKPPFDVVVGSDLIYYTYSPETPHSELLL